MSRGTLATISREALQHNYAKVRALAPSSKIWSVVKANGYGHGVNAVAQALSGSDGFAVATLQEALELRSLGFQHPILLLEGITSAADLSEVYSKQLHLMLQSAGQVQQVISFGLPLNVWVKIDTGMHRLGFAPENVIDVQQKLALHSHITVHGYATHFACADIGKGNKETLDQISIFNSVKPDLGASCIANSAGIIDFPQSHGQWVRPGIMLYGASPFEDRSAESLGLLPVMTLTAPIISIRTIKQGESVGYGGRWQANQESTIATLAIGYADGYPRHAPDGTPVYIDGVIVPLAGRVSMDMIIIDISNHPHKDQIKIGDNAELWGEHLPVDRVASNVGTIGYELLTRVSTRVERKAIR